MTNKYSTKQRLLALAENRLVASDLYESTIKTIDAIKEKLRRVEKWDIKRINQYKSELFIVYQNYMDAVKQIDINNKSQLQ